MDLRMYLGMESIIVENEVLVKMLVQREQDHHNWLDRLEKCVEEGTVFDGELDPHKCAFGRWYDFYHTDNLLLEGILRRFDRPHKAIHGIGDRVKTLQARGDKKGAMELVSGTRHGELSEMEHLFEQARQILQNDSREIAVIIASGTERLGVTVDSVESVEALNPESFTEPPLQTLSTCGELICGTARRAKTDQMVMLFDTMHLLQENSAAMAV